MQNWRADVIGLASSQGGLVDHVRYSPYGVPTRVNPVDIADDAGNALSSSSGANGGVNEGDYNSFMNEFLSNGAGAGADIASAAGEIFPGGDGVVDSGDYTLFFNEYFVTYARGQLTADSVANRLGYAGYEFDPVLIGSGSGAAASDPTCFYHVRHRVYDSQNGRWTRRDPLGYVDGMGLYEYCRSQSTYRSDPYGLDCGGAKSFYSTIVWTTSCTPAQIAAITAAAGSIFDYTSAACAKKCPTITIKCVAECNHASAGDCDIQIGPPCTGESRISPLEYNKLIRHEFHHIWQNCTSDLNDSDCDVRMAREYDAYHTAGQCVTQAPNTGPGSCCDRACDSVMHDSSCYFWWSSCLARCKALCAAGGCMGGMPNHLLPWGIIKRKPLFPDFGPPPRPGRRDLV